MKKILLSLLLCSITITVFHTYLNPKFPYTNDGENHLARFSNYKIALKEGQLPPRFAPNLMNHYGYPVFNFNYPLANILSLPFSILKIHPEFSFKAISIIMYIFGLVGMYQLMNIQKHGLLVTVVGISLYGINPYITNVVLFRGSIGELLALSFFPWLLWSLEYIYINKKFETIPVILFTGFLLSHNVTVVLLMSWLIPYIVLKGLKNRQFIYRSLLTVLLALGMTLWFWLPALVEANQTVVKEAGIANQLQDQFVTFSQLLFGQLGFGFSYNGPVDSLGFQLGYPHVLIMLISVVVLLKLIAHKQQLQALPLYFTVSSIVLIILQLQVSSVFWHTFSFLRIIQFPWRLSILLVILVPVLWSYSAQYYSRSLKKFIILSIILYTYLLGRLKPVDYFHRNPIDYDLFSQSTSTQNENRTKEFTYTEIGDWQPTPRIVGNGQVVVHHWTGTDRIYTLDLKRESTIIEPTMNFLGWETLVKDSLNNSTRKIVYIKNNDIAGRIAYSLPQGQYTVTSRFTQNTPARIIGNSITVIALIALGSIFIFQKKSFKYE